VRATRAVEALLLGAVALASSLSLLALAGSTWAALKSSGPRMAQVERSISASLHGLASRLDATELQVRGSVTEAQALFDRAQTERRSATAARSKMETAAARVAAGAEVEVQVPDDPIARRAHALRLVEQRLAGGGA